MYEVCRRSFLSLWSYANPRQSSAKELCDVLVVCEPDVVVVSVKDAGLDLKAAPEVAVRRWLKRAVKKSVDQLYGAVRWLARNDRVVRSDGSDGLPLPPSDARRVHRIAVGLGGSRAVPLPSGDFGKGFVHVLDEKSFFLLLSTLDTVTDFVHYLTTKEALAERCPGLVVEGEENLLAVYLDRGRKFPEDCPEGPVPDGLWEQLVAKRGYQRKLEEDRVSYVWDRLVEYFAEHALAGTFEFGNELTENERAFRAMARESRLDRRGLGDSLKEFLRRAKGKELRSRMCKSTQGVGYVFLNASPSDTREFLPQAGAVLAVLCGPWKAWLREDRWILPKR